jgi:hypothetical protein
LLQEGVEDIQDEPWFHKEVDNEEFLYMAENIYANILEQIMNEYTQ